MKTIESEIKLDEFKAFAIYEVYYQLMISLDLNKTTRKHLNSLMDYHFRKVYSKEYNKNFFDVTDEKYICIATLEKN